MVLPMSQPIFLSPYFPQLVLQFGVFLYEMETRECTVGIDKGQGFREGLRTHVVAQEIDYAFVACNKSPYNAHCFLKIANKDVYTVLNPEMLGGANSLLAHYAQAMGVAYHPCEVIFLLKVCNLVQGNQFASECQYALGDEQHTAVL